MSSVYCMNSCTNCEYKRIFAHLGVYFQYCPLMKIRSRQNKHLSEYICSCWQLQKKKKPFFQNTIIGCEKFEYVDNSGRVKYLGVTSLKKN